MNKIYLLVVIFAISSIAMLLGAYSTLIEENFAVSSPPAGWSIAGTVGTSHTTVGTAKTNTDFFKNDGGANYLRLTENASYNRAWAYYTNSTFKVMGKWRLTAEVRIGKTHNGNEITDGADGLCFVFLDASTITTGGVFDPSKVTGGYGEFEGAPRGGLPNTPVSGALGYHAGLKGFSLEFDHYNNTNELYREYIHWVDLNDWVHSGLGADLSSNTSFYYNDGWQRFQVEANAGILTFSYNWNGTSFNNSFTMDTLNPPDTNCDDLSAFDAYFGICAATGGQTAFHEVRYTKLETEEVTLPVELSSFTAIQNATNTAQINWTTQTETGLAGFRIMRNTLPELSSAIQVSPLIEASNSSQTMSYVFVDTEVEAGQTFYYWLQSQEISGESNYHGPIFLTLTGDPGNPPPMVLITGIQNLYPNPFNPDLTVSYYLENPTYVKLSVVNLRGQVIRLLDQLNQTTGSHTLYWDGKDDQGQVVPSGVYFIRMDLPEKSFVKRAVLLK